MAENVADGVAKMNVSDKAWSFVSSLWFFSNVFHEEFINSFSEEDRDLVSKNDEYGVFEFLIHTILNLYRNCCTYAFVPKPDTIVFASLLLLWSSDWHI